LGLTIVVFDVLINKSNYHNTTVLKVLNKKNNLLCEMCYRIDIIKNA